MTDKQTVTDGQTDDYGKTICLPRRRGAGDKKKICFIYNKYHKLLHLVPWKHWKFPSYFILVKVSIRVCRMTQLSSRSHPRHLVGKRTAKKDTTIDITSDSHVNSNFPYRWSPASLTFNNYFYLFLYITWITINNNAPHQEPHWDGQQWNHLGAWTSLRAWPQGYKTFFMLHSTEHEILNAHKYKNHRTFSTLYAQISL